MKGKALWTFIFDSMRQRRRFDKMKLAINKANNLPETLELVEQKKSLEDYLK